MKKSELRKIIREELNEISLYGDFPAPATENKVWGEVKKFVEKITLLFPSSFEEKEVAEIIIEVIKHRYKI